MNKGIKYPALVASVLLHFSKAVTTACTFRDLISV